jgi:hypothetical protein
MLERFLIVTGPIASIAAVISVILAYRSLRHLSEQVSKAKALARCQFISELEREIVGHYETYAKLLPQGVWSLEGAGIWSTARVGPQNRNDIARVVAYLGFFAKIKFLIDSEVVELEDVDRMFAFRFFLVVNNRHVQRKILRSREYTPYWSVIQELYDKWTAHRTKRGRPIPFEENSLGSYNSEDYANSPITSSEKTKE